MDASHLPVLGTTYDLLAVLAKTGCDLKGVVGEPLVLGVHSEVVRVVQPQPRVIGRDQELFWDVRPRPPPATTTTAPSPTSSPATTHASTSTCKTWSHALAWSSDYRRGSRGWADVDAAGADYIAAAAPPSATSLAAASAAPAVVLGAAILGAAAFGVIVFSLLAIFTGAVFAAFTVLAAATAPFVVIFLDGIRLLEREAADLAAALFCPPSVPALDLGEVTHSLRLVEEHLLARGGGREAASAAPTMT